LFPRALAILVEIEVTIILIDFFDGFHDQDSFFHCPKILLVISFQLV
jgi:hypothetical protein